MACTINISYSYKEVYNMTYPALQSIHLINLYNELLRWAGTTYLQIENTKLIHIAFGLPYNASMLSPCNLYVYHNASLTKEERIYASVSIGSGI